MCVAQVRITAVNKVRNYIAYAMNLLDDKGHSSVVLKAMGKAINKSVIVGAPPAAASAACGPPAAGVHVCAHHFAYSARPHAQLRSSSAASLGCTS